MASPERSSKQPGRDAPARRSIWSEAGEGVRFVLGHQTLRPIVIGVGIFALFDSAFFGLYVLYVSRDLGVSAGELGLIFVLGGIGGTLGAIVAGRLARRFGLGRTVVGALILAGAGDMLIPWAALVTNLTVLLLGIAEFVVTFGVSVFMVTETTPRQQITPDALQGRMHATIGLLVGGCNAVGALGGGLVAEYVGAAFVRC